MSNAIIPDDVPLKELLKSVGVNVVRNETHGVRLVSSKTGEKLHKTPCASYELGQEIYLNRIKEQSND